MQDRKSDNQTDRMVVSQGPFDFIQKSKNPCYYGENKTIHCLPYFYVVGFSKCGTTDLHSRVGQHPQVMSVKKEMQWFSRRRFPEFFYDRTVNSILLSDCTQTFLNMGLFEEHVCSPHSFPLAYIMAEMVLLLTVST